jgi:hypothetical protein
MLGVSWRMPMATMPPSCRLDRQEPSIDLFTAKGGLGSQGCCRDGVKLRGMRRYPCEKSTPAAITTTTARNEMHRHSANRAVRRIGIVGQAATSPAGVGDEENCRCSMASYTQKQ